MKNKPLIIAVILIMLLGLGGYFYMKKAPSSQSTDSNTMMAEQKTGTGMMSMKDLLALGKNQTCTFSSTNENVSTSGTSYISNGKMRTDFTTTDQTGKSNTGSMINDGSYVYSWSSESNQGMKLAMTDTMNKAVEEAKQDFANNPNKYVNPDEKMDYKCSSWSPDTSKFEPPSTITFTDYSEMMKKMQDATQANPEIKNAQCSACDSLPEGDSKTMCKKSLNCE